MLECWSVGEVGDEWSKIKGAYQPCADELQIALLDRIGVDFQLPLLVGRKETLLAGARSMTGHAQPNSARRGRFVGYEHLGGRVSGGGETEFLFRRLEEPSAGCP